jgi:periplasmic divalent cation tolerance protein
VNLSIFLTTVAKKSDARRLAQAALESRAAACVQILPKIESHYVWKGRKNISREFVLIAKTVSTQRKALEKLWRKLHPYDCPELLSLSAKSSAEYGRWVRSCVR